MVEAASWILAAKKVLYVCSVSSRQQSNQYMSSHLLLSMHAGRAHVKALSKRKESGALCASKPYLFLATGHAGLLDLLSFQRQAVCVGANEFDCGGCGARAAAHGDGHDGRAGEWASAKKICDRPARLTSGTFFFPLPPVASGHQAAIGAMSVDGRIQSIDVLWDQRSAHAAASSARLCWSGALATGRTLNRVQTIREAVWWRELEVLGLPPTFSGGGVGLAKFRKAAYLCI